MDKITVYFSCIVLATCLCFNNSTWANPNPKYFDAVQQEITRLGYIASCQKTTGICTLKKSLDEATTENNSVQATILEQITIHIDDSSSTVRIAIDNYISGELLTLTLARTLLQLNHQLVVSKLSIDKESQAISLSAIVNTDSNFDRKTFRSVLTGFIMTASTIKEKLTVQN